MSHDALNKGPIAWMARHGVAPNLLMLALLIGGLLTALSIKKEFLPEFTVDIVQVRVVYPGATPTEMEQGVVLPIENELSEMDGIDEVSSSIQEGYAAVNLEIESGEDIQQMYQDILQSVNRISTFPEQMEQPIISIWAGKHDLMDIALHGNLDDFSMKRLAERIKEKLLTSAHVSQVTLKGTPAEEVHVEIPSLVLEKYQLTLSKIAQIISANAIEQGAGTVKTQGGDILVTLNDRKYWADEYAALPLVTDENGVLLTLGDVATVKEGFEDSPNIVTLDGGSSVQISVYRTGDQTPPEVADAIYDMWDELEAMLPPGMHLTVTDDDAQMYKDRLGLLIKNAVIGLLLVFILLGVFLEYRLAFWVTMGIPISFLGAMLFLPNFDVSINMISMFAFIISLGIVVDDAIIAGENIYANLNKGLSRVDAAIQGAKEVAMPLTFAILTNIVAFMPLFFLPGGMGKAMMVIPAVVVLCFVISWVEALFILPAHISHLKDKPDSKLGQKLGRIQLRVDTWLRETIHNYYRPLLAKSLSAPGITLSIAIAVAIVMFAFPISGRMGFSMFPVLEGESAVLDIEMPQNAPVSELLRVRAQAEAALQAVMAPIEAEHGAFLQNTTSKIEGTSLEVEAKLSSGENRPYTTNQVVTMWRESLGEVVGAKNVSFDAERGGGPVSGKPFTMELRGSHTETLKQASEELTAILESLSGMKDVSSSFTNGKPQWDIQLNDEGRSLGLTAMDVASQVRAAFYGVRALRQQRGKNEVTVLVRLPEQERQYQTDIEQLQIVTANGARVPLQQIAVLEKTTAPTLIQRKQGQRLVSVSAAVEPRSLIPSLQATLAQEYLPELQQKYPSIKLGYGGRQADEQESKSSLLQGLVFTLMGIYILLAVPFKSYTQPLLIMAVIPFGIVGALAGLLLLGSGLSIIAIMGMLALCGVVVNDSLILVDYANQLRRSGLSAKQAIMDAAERRFRPILLTTLTTFGGLAPMVFETSRQAKFITPMAISLGFGILFTTFVCLLVLPTLFILLEGRKALSKDSSVEMS
ncbi:efflux RND transporter permease subunit [Oceaniserpentilla sp. 4NH20-0058]|uniref:efflux RND transporter permease subunit n=1 Tax=Oceaniserpentilla sp. 4NH20-0058 TaxID=3127660 RepID=UPI003102B078